MFCVKKQAQKAPMEAGCVVPAAESGLRRFPVTPSGGTSLSLAAADENRRLYVHWAERFTC